MLVYHGELMEWTLSVYKLLIARKKLGKPKATTWYLIQTDVPDYHSASVALPRASDFTPVLTGTFDWCRLPPTLGLFFAASISTTFRLKRTGTTSRA